jgi:6-phosphofructokinase 1
VIRDGKEVSEDVSDQVTAKIRKLDLDALIVVGGDGTLGIARDLFEKGVPTVGVPKTIDNDVAGTEATFGFDTALNVAVEAIDRLRTTAESHQRVMLLELMGRDAGFIALHAGLSGGADVILIPEIPFSPQVVAEKVKERHKQGQLDSIIVVSEGAKPIGGKQVYSRRGDELHVPRLGGISLEIGAYLESECQTETRVTILGHIQRGGIPTAFDRWLATEFGAESVRLAADGGFGRMVAYQSGRIVTLSFADALNKPKRVDPNGDAVRTARGLGISLGDK